MKKTLLVKHANDFLKGRQWFINAFEIEIFPMRSKNINGDNHYIYDDEL